MCHNKYMTESEATPMRIATTITPYDHQNGGDWPGMRGVLIEAERPHAPGIVLSRNFPGVWISAAGDVELDERGGRYPAEAMLEWLEFLTARLRELIPGGEA